MRLINTSDHRLVNFSAPIPRYAILSHVWENEELDFQQYQDPYYMDSKGVKQSGWDKISQFCKLAKSRDIDWVWVDTCCIDKSSSAELSEAINSMAQWYKNARFCAAFISDVDTLRHQPLAESKWFTRGWTLQELIFPKEFEFYDCRWNFICTRKDACEAISAKTSIPAPLLFEPDTYRYHWFSIAQRLSWISRRKTTRPEDLIYCMFGLLHVNMSLLYGEGLKGALYRLQLEVLNKSDDESIFAWSSTLSAGSMIADDIRDFSLCEDVRSIDKHGISRHYFMTNKGLRVQLALCKISEMPLDILPKLRQYPRDWYIAPINAIKGELPLFLILERAENFDGTFCRRSLVTGNLSLEPFLGKATDIYVRRTSTKYVHVNGVEAINADQRERENLEDELRKKIVASNAWRPDIPSFDRFALTSDSAEIIVFYGRTDERLLWEHESLHEYLNRLPLPEDWKSQYERRASKLKFASRMRRV